jgi:hypothetical protein
MARGRLHTTTVRFDADTWATIVAESDRLGIAHAEYIRGAVLRHVGRRDLEERVVVVERRVGAISERQTTVARIVASSLARRGLPEVCESRCARSQLKEGLLTDS